jgi:hypothetical protein
MKKIIAILLLGLISLFSLGGCDIKEVESEKVSGNSMFVKVENTGSWYVVYHKETRVMYVVSNDRHNRGNFTIMVDENGNPLLWQGE